MKFTRHLTLFLALLMLASFGYAQSAGTASANSSKTSTTSSKSKKSTNSTSKTSKSAKLDINTASKQELSQLPGIGDALSQKIIDGRPYNAKNDLVRRKIIPQSTYDGIKDQIIAHHEAGASKASKKGGSGASK